MKLYSFDAENGDYILEWHGEFQRFALWFDDKECDWTYVNKYHDKDDMSCDELSKETLEKMYEKIGKILGK